MEEFDFTNIEAVKGFLEEKSARHKSISEYALEYSGSDEGRKLRKLQIGKRENYTQGSNNTPVEAERIKINLQRKIVQTAVSFLFGDAPEIISTNAKGEEILDVFKKNRLYSKLMKFAEAVLSETIGVFISSKEEDGEIKTRLYTSENGKFTPKYDNYGDLIAFFWEFELDDVKHIWIFDQTKIYTFANEKFVDEKEHGFDVIPVVFTEQKKPEWWEVKEMIDRIEMIASKLAASNNYFAFPILMLLGSMAKDDKGNDISPFDLSDDGKTLLASYAEKNGQLIKSEAKFLERDTGNDSIKMEIEYLKEFIFNISQTPDLSFNNVKGIGAISGRALTLMLQDAINKARWKQADYKIAIERLLKVIQSGLGNSSEDIEFDIDFKYSLPRDIKEEIETLVTATGNKPILSIESAVKQSPLTVSDDEAEKLKAEQIGSLGESVNL